MTGLIGKDVNFIIDRSSGITKSSGSNGPYHAFSSLTILSCPFAKDVMLARYVHAGSLLEERTRFRGAPRAQLRLVNEHI